MPNDSLRPAAGRPGYLATLDGWRAVAILGVLIYHDQVRKLGFFNTGVLHKYGNLGVQLFFAISGLLITTRLLEEERVFGRFSLKGFYVRRVFRIQPAALFYLGSMVLAHLIVHLPFSYKGLLEALALVRNITNWDHAKPGMLITAHFWSLSIEEQFYLALPFALLLLRSRKLRLTLLFSAGLAFLCWSAIAQHLSYYTDLRAQHTELNLHGLLLGSGLAVLVSHAKTRERVRRYLGPTTLLIGCVLLIALHAWKPHHYLLWITAAFPFVVLGTVLRPESLLSRVLEWAPLRFVGRISYSLYLWQQLVFVVGHLAAGTRLWWVDRAPVNYLLACACALFSYHVIERPMIRLGHRVAPPPTPGRTDLNEPAQVQVAALA